MISLNITTIITAGVLATENIFWHYGECKIDLFHFSSHVTVF